jgi:hypothetical protein
MVSRQDVQAELDRVLASSAFKGSRRSSDFLRFVVDSSLSGHPESIKERTIGVEVFGRPADYDTSEDAIVRVKANEVRKRLAQAYQEIGTDGPVHIEIPAGGYVPEFRPVTNVVTSRNRAPAQWFRSRWTVFGGLAVVLAGVLAGAWALWGPHSAFDRFWQPFLSGEAQPMLCVAHPTVFTMSAELRDAGTVTLERADLNRDEEHYVGVGDAQAMARVASLLAARGRSAQLRLGNDTSFTDLRNAPAILIGAFTNQWTMELGQDLRFVFEKEPGGRMWVQDQQPPRQRFEYERTAPPMDFVILSRLFDSRSGQPVIMAAGLAHLGTQVAGEFLTTPAYFNEAMKGAPEGWERKNLQIVLRAEVLGKSPGPPRVVAIHVW